MLVVAAVPLAACSASRSSSGSTTANPSSAGLTEALKYTDCMRANGITNYPDPSSNGRQQTLSNINLQSPAFQKAYEACRTYLPSGQDSGPAAPTAAQMHVALAFAQCMRKHGFPQFPDPLTTAQDGPNLTLGQGMYYPLNSTTDFQTPSLAFRQAARACGIQLP